MTKLFVTGVAGARKCCAVETDTTKKNGVSSPKDLTRSRIVMWAVLGCAVMFMSVSCATISKTGLAAPIAYSEVVPDLMKAEFDFNLEQKKTGRASAWYLLNFWKVAGDSRFSEVKGAETNASIFGNRVAKVKSAAIYNALQGTNADMIIAPQYDTETVSYLFGLLKSYKVTVKGYEATLKRVYQKKADENVSISMPMNP